MSIERSVALVCHRSTPSAVVRAIQVVLRRSIEAELRITFRLEGDIPQLILPPPSVPRVGVELWRHTCFESFIAIEGRPAYHEFNFAPSGEWTVHSFRAYRDGGPIVDEKIRPEIAMRSTDSWFEMNARVRLDSLSGEHPRATLRLGIAAVIEAGDGFSYWALCHPAGKPDFHHSDGFALLLEPLQS
jgi:hypothetical protein